MKLTCSKSILLEGITNVQRAVDARTTLPILTGILIKAENNLILTGYNMELGIRFTMPADIREQGSLVVDSKLFGEIIRRLSDEQIHMTLDANNMLNIQCGNSEFNIKAQSSESYPELILKERVNELTLDQKVLRTLIRQTLISVSTDPTRTNLNGCFFTSLGDHVEMVGIDGFRVSIARHRAPQGMSWPEFSCILPTKTLRDLLGLLDEEGEVTLILNQNQVVFDFGRNLLISRIISENYIEYTKVQPENRNSRMKMSRKAFLDSIDRATLMSSVDVKRVPVNLQSEKGCLGIHASTQQGNFHELVETALEGETFDIDFNPYYLIDALKVIEDENLQLALTGSMGPAILEPLEGDDYLFLILPLRK